MCATALAYVSLGSCELRLLLWLGECSDLSVCMAVDNKNTHASSYHRDFETGPKRSTNPALCLMQVCLDPRSTPNNLALSQNDRYLSHCFGYYLRPKYGNLSQNSGYMGHSFVHFRGSSREAGTGKPVAYDYGPRSRRYGLLEKIGRKPLLYDEVITYSM